LLLNSDEERFGGWGNEIPAEITAGKEPYHYQDYSGREIDAVIELSDGKWGAFEIKLGANQIDHAAENLKEIYKSIKEDRDGVPPSVMCIICGMSNAAYKRDDGIFVIPITALKD